MSGYGKPSVHYYTVPCKSFSMWGLETTENKAEITCLRCLKHKDLPKYSKKRGKYVKAKPIKLKDVPPTKGDHFKYKRFSA